METIGDRIKLERKKCGYTQETLAKTLYFSDKAISSWENNRTKPDIKSLCVLSETLNTTIDYLLYGNKTKEKDEIPEFVKEPLQKYPGYPALYIDSKGGVFTADAQPNWVKDAILYQNPYYKQ